eukprot:7545373-Pyramimonas_sp.AAC.1
MAGTARPRCVPHESSLCPPSDQPRYQTAWYALRRISPGIRPRDMPSVGSAPVSDRVIRPPSDQPRYQIA